MTTLHLGVDSIAYAREGKVTTTGDVAEYLEADYGVMRTFLELHEQEIADAVATQLEEMLKDAKAGSPLVIGIIPFPKIFLQFAEYLDTQEWERTSGQTVEAAQAGVSHRKKLIYSNANGPRPAFVDTGLYQQSFRAWMSK